MAQSPILNEYQAAALVGLSPTLLVWLTKYAPKQSDDRKLKTESIKDGVRFFETEELVAFNAWLKKPWPKKEGQKRPPIPKGIREEIKIEANAACAICHGHKDSCEAAHIDPVAKSKNNHPENLIWLCSNHHTVFDKGYLGPNKEDAEFVISLKRVLHKYKAMLWGTQAEVSGEIFHVLSLCKALKGNLASASTAEQVGAIEALAMKVVAVVPSLAPVSKADPKFEAFKTIDLTFASVAKKQNVSEFLQKAEEAHDAFVVAMGYVVCPVCKGSGIHNGVDCAACQGDGQIDQKFAADVDPRQYELVKCPVCNGSGRHDGDDCPGCGGEGKLEQRFADLIDMRGYEKVQCRMCQGSGRRRDEPCPACLGEGELEKRFADDPYMAMYEYVDCPICKASGYFDGEVCDACHGDRQMEFRYADQIRVADYSKVRCPICTGSGIRKGDTCHACQGDGDMDRRVAVSIDPRDYEDVDCPKCEGSGYFDGDTCTTCHGDRQFERRYLNNF